MNKLTLQSKIESAFRKQVLNDRNVKNAYLLVHSEKLGLHLNIAEGKTDGSRAHPQQPNHLASVGKLFTATLIGILYDKGLLSFDDKISNYLDDELMSNLHVYKGKNYSEEIKIRHLLNQSSGLNDVFYQLWKKLVKEPQTITPREAVIWGKNNLKPKFKPGKKHFYTDTNYYLLGLIIENITNKKYHEVLHQYIFEPLGMDNAYMFGYSKPSVKSDFPVAKPYINKTDALSVKGIAQIDYAGGGVIATLEEYLKFMKALVSYKLVNKNTLQQMKSDDHRSYPTIRYGYAIWRFITIPLFLPEKYNCWGCVGVTGAFMFYHPKTESYIIGTFNDMSYRSKALRFMLQKLIRPLLNLEV
jgi:D-alanyl-D-alanine carboxypeptidase